MPADFLRLQVQWHEALEACEQTGDEGARQRLFEEVKEHQRLLIASLAKAFDTDHDDKAAFEATRELMFVNKLITQIQH